MRRTALKPRRRPAPIDRAAAEAWRRAALQRPCAVCGAEQGIVGHHILHQQVLRRAASVRVQDYERVRWDRRGLLSLCADCHAAHHFAVRRITIATLERHAPDVFQLAFELHLLWWLERTYR